MRTWVVARGPDAAKVEAEARRLAEGILGPKGQLIVCPTGIVKLEDMPAGSVTVLLLEDDTYSYHVVDEKKTRYMILALGLESAKRAELVRNSMQVQGPVGVVGKDYVKVYPEGTPLEECVTVVLDYPSADEQFRTIRFDAESSYSHMTAKRLTKWLF